LDAATSWPARAALAGAARASTTAAARTGSSAAAACVSPRASAAEAAGPMARPVRITATWVTTARAAVAGSARPMVAVEERTGLALRATPAMSSTKAPAEWVLAAARSTAGTATRAIAPTAANQASEMVVVLRSAHHVASWREEPATFKATMGGRRGGQGLRRRSDFPPRITGSCRVALRRTVQAGYPAVSVPRSCDVPDQIVASVLESGDSNPLQSNRAWRLPLPAAGLLPPHAPG
jgi:hypothetical protein